MDGPGSALIILGLIVAFIGAMRLLVEAFSTSIVWGLVVLLVHPLILVFVFLHWGDAKGPFINYLIGVGMVFVGLVMRPG
jgi:hypothetical protein